MGDFVGGPEYLSLLIPPLQRLAMQEETVVREQVGITNFIHRELELDLNKGASLLSTMMVVRIRTILIDAWFF